MTEFPVEIFLIYILPAILLIYYSIKKYKLGLFEIDFTFFAIAIAVGIIPFCLWACLCLYRYELYKVSEEHIKYIKENEKEKTRSKYFKGFIQMHGYTMEDVDEYIESRSLLHKLLK